MAPILALDIGKRRTGAALGDDERPYILALNTIHHVSENELVNSVSIIVKEKSITRIILGLPRRLDGSIGKQATFVHQVGDMIAEATKIAPEYIDERYTSFSSKESQESDKDASAACSILEVALSRNRSI